MSHNELEIYTLPPKNNFYALKLFLLVINLSYIEGKLNEKIIFSTNNTKYL